MTSCQKIEWQDFPPEDFQGKFIQVSDPIIQGYEQPETIEISENTLKHVIPENEWSKTRPILRVSKRGNQIVIFCGQQNANHIADFRYELVWGADNYLYISEIVGTGYNNEDDYFPIGKFTHYE